MHSNTTRCENSKKNTKPTTTRIPSSPPGTKLLFLGSGSSTGCPRPICSLIFPEDDRYIQDDPRILQLQKDLAERCKMSKFASMGDPKTNKNYRNNPSLLISHVNNDDEEEEGEARSGNDENRELRNVIIDVGKTFREGAIRWMPHHGIFSIDGIVITHEHADAMMGLDDLRGFQQGVYGHSKNSRTHPLPLYLSNNCFETIKMTFGYLVPKPKQKIQNDDGTPKVIRHVASLDFRTVQHFQPFVVAGLKMIPLPVIHGEDFICNGYAFSVKGKKNRDNKNRGMDGKNENENENITNVVYLSDISRMIPETEKYILEELPPTDILVVDSLLQSRKHAVHFNLEEALELVERLRPKRTYIVGISCDDFPDHDEANKIIAERNPTVRLAHDGLAIEL
eukprot:CAMPEP_0204644532 /NCGR_PEP_ID=MMETSP0718-20130828/1553_1 /ASSEMBLY_ACC=CAM_ASM_000674 /TAXON_ID=230516 /ORGANISM="Chaetoceros curvisetus" /LENGTH=394 /DNA_ID=CAMNT_0051666139 /DNA_START=1 /DNA_END=1185 /DNA_ORIENTATION=+